MGQHFGEYLDSLKNDYQRYQACRAKAEGLRNQWFAGQKREINRIMDLAIAGDHRYQRMSPGEMQATGESNWSLRKESKDLAGAEQMYWRWAMGYLQATQYRSPMSLMAGSLPVNSPPST
jgi:hypothetical protein